MARVNTETVLALLDTSLGENDLDDDQGELRQLQMPTVTELEIPTMIKGNLRQLQMPTVTDVPIVELVVAR